MRQLMGIFLAGALVAGQPTSLHVHVTALQLPTAGSSGGTAAKLDAAVRAAVREHPHTQLVTLPSHYLPVGQPVAPASLRALAKELRVSIVSTGWTLSKSGNASVHFAAVIGQDGAVVLNRSSATASDSALDCGVEQGFDVAMLQLSSSISNDPIPGSPAAPPAAAPPPVGIGLLLGREWECFHGPRALMLKQADIILVSGNQAPKAGAPTMALYTRAWENVLGLLLTNPSEAGGTQAYLGVKDTAAGIGLTLLAPTPPGVAAAYPVTFDLEALRSNRTRAIWGDAFRRPVV